MRYGWTVYDGIFPVTTLASSSNDPRHFVLDAYSLTPGRNYTVKVLASAQNPVNNFTVFGTAAFTFLVGRSSVAAVITGGSERTISVNQSVTLDASTSYDLDYPSQTSTLTYVWSCLMTLPNRGSSCGGFASSQTSSSVVLHGSRLGAGTYNVTVRVTNQNRSSSSTSVLLTVVSRAVPIVTIATPQR
eukprot:gene25073-31186_t